MGALYHAVFDLQARRKLRTAVNALDRKIVRRRTTKCSGRGQKRTASRRCPLSVAIRYSQALGRDWTPTNRRGSYRTHSARLIPNQVPVRERPKPLLPAVRTTPRRWRQERLFRGSWPQLFRGLAPISSHFEVRIGNMGRLRLS